MNLVCPVCEKEFYKKRSIVDRAKHRLCCCKNCANTFRSFWFSGEGNHQKGLKGKNNSSFKTDITIMKRGTQKYEFEYLPWHPFAESTGRVRRHRALVEQNYSLFDSSFFMSVLCSDLIQRAILKPKYDVHHKNSNTLDNSLDNLEVLTKGEHTRTHNLAQPAYRDKITGRFTRGVTHAE